ncbi:MAG: two pore domain potassium channel family protein [Pirellulales bacterium]|nr:two pore domain potassium channel family protein [Pirellulales bacterium]
MSSSIIDFFRKYNNWYVHLQYHRFNLLLSALVILYLSMPVIQLSFPGPDHIMGRIIIAALFAALLLAVIFAISRRPLVFRIALWLAVPYLVLDVAVVFTDNSAVEILQHVINIVFLGFISLAILSYVFSVETIRFNTISAALCVYLMLGLLWAVVFSLLTFIDKDAFNMSFETNTEVSEKMRFGSGDSIYPVYFSIVTLTTLGYGDITPANSFSRTLASFEAMMGQLYLAVLVARLVSMHTSQSFRRRYGGQESEEPPPPDRKN